MPISLGPLEQKNQFFTVIPSPSWKSFGGVRIDGLISHGFLKEYAWTIDFRRRKFRFAVKDE